MDEDEIDYERVKKRTNQQTGGNRVKKQVEYEEEKKSENYKSGD